MSEFTVTVLYTIAEGGQPVRAHNICEALERKRVKVPVLNNHTPHTPRDVVSRVLGRLDKGLRIRKIERGLYVPLGWKGNVSVAVAANPQPMNNMRKKP